jgi:hypothetical protein
VTLKTGQNMHNTRKNNNIQQKPPQAQNVTIPASGLHQRFSSVAARCRYGTTQNNLRNTVQFWYNVFLSAMLMTELNFR